MAAGNTYVALAEQTLGSATASVTFSSISGAYTDLVLVCNFGTTASNPAINMSTNGDTGANYSFTVVWGDAGGALSGRATNRNSTNNNCAFTNYGASTSYANDLIINLQNYANTTTYKTTIYRWGAADKEVGAGVTLWRSTSAVTSFTVGTAVSTFASGSTFTLYGILAA